MLPGLCTGNLRLSNHFYLLLDRRIATLDLQARKMKFLFKKWLVSNYNPTCCCNSQLNMYIQDFETAHGSEGGVSEVKNSAQRYLESRGGTAEPEPS